MASIIEAKGAKITRWRAVVRRKAYSVESAYFNKNADAQSWARSNETKVD